MCKVNQKVSGKKRQITRDGSLRNSSIQQVGKTIVACKPLLREGMAREGKSRAKDRCLEAQGSEGGGMWSK